MNLLIGLLGGCAAMGAVFGWIRGTRAIAHRTLDPMDSPFSNRNTPSAALSQMKRQRLYMVVLFALVGAAGGAGALLYLAH
jgi:hypothetical protein